MSRHHYIERSDRAFCDFCTSGDPIMIWHLPEGHHIDMHVVDEKKREVIHSVRDEDGEWAACEDCHEAVLAYKKAKLRDSALRRFISNVGKRRPDMAASYPNVKDIAKAIQRHQVSLFKRLLPLVTSPTPWEPKLSTQVITAEGPPELMDFTRKMREDMHKDWERRHPDDTASAPEMKSYEAQEPSPGAIKPPFPIPDGPSRGKRYTT